MKLDGVIATNSRKSWLASIQNAQSYSEMTEKKHQTKGYKVSYLIQCIYSSVVSNTFREEELPGLLAAARTANAKRNVTGMLAYINGNFLQVIEGEEGVVDSLFKKLEVDPRHKRVLLLARERIAVRSFSDWSMAFEALLPSDVGTLVGENDFFDSGSCVSALDPGIVKTILSSFRNAQTERA